MVYTISFVCVCVCGYFYYSESNEHTFRFPHLSHAWTGRPPVWLPDKHKRVCTTHMCHSYADRWNTAQSSSPKTNSKQGKTCVRVIQRWILACSKQKWYYHALVHVAHGLETPLYTLTWYMSVSTGFQCVYGHQSCVNMDFYWEAYGRRTMSLFVFNRLELCVSRDVESCVSLAKIIKYTNCRNCFGQPHTFATIVVS